MEIGVVFTRVGVSGSQRIPLCSGTCTNSPDFARAGSGEPGLAGLRSHGHRAPSLPSGPHGETFLSTTNQITHKGLEQEKLQNLWCSAFGALTPVFCLLASLTFPDEESRSLFWSSP